MNARITALLERLRELPGAVVAFSGGVDSSMLLDACVRALGPQRVLAVTAQSPSLPARELDEARRVAAEIGAPHRIVETRELAREGYRRNGPDRCYFCKTELFEKIAIELRGAAQSSWPVLFGAIADDAGDHRPGARAAAERGVLAPLAEAGIDKREVRRYSRERGLSTADKPSFACLSSRVPYGTEIDAGVLARLERAEEVLRRLGFRQYRVRHHGAVARLEVLPEDMSKAVRCRDEIARGLRALGYVYIALDLCGYRSGAMNEVLGRES